MTIAMPRLDRSTAAERGLTIADFLVPITVAERLNTRVRDTILIGVGALFIYLTSLVVVPHDPIPWTGQTFGVLMAGGALGLRRGLLAVALYVLLGYVGLPFFAEGRSGASVILGPSGGYLVGFIVAAAVVGRLAELGWDRRFGGALGMMLIGSAIIYAIGLPWLASVKDLTPSQTISNGLTPFVLWDAVKLSVAAGIFPVTWWLIGRRPDDR
jgi:biotin transport system substrate-specific component